MSVPDNDTGKESRPEVISRIYHFTLRLHVTKGRKEERRPVGNKKLNGCVRSAGSQGIEQKEGLEQYAQSDFIPRLYRYDE